MAGENPYGVDMEAVLEQQCPKEESFLVGTDVFPRYRDAP